jgi:peroxiredoxin Q/BCP
MRRKKMPKELKIGVKAPDFSLFSQMGKKISLKSFLRKNVVLYFYPKDFTSG